MVLQLLLSLPDFVQRYHQTALQHMADCARYPPDCFHCQIAKMAYGLASGDYSVPKKHKTIIYEGQTQAEREQEHFYQEGIRPSMFKTLLGKGHPDFSTSQQQDAALYLAYVLDKINKAEKLAHIGDPTDIFRFQVETKLKCQSCGGVRYSKQDQPSLTLPVPLPPGKIDENTIVSLDQCVEWYWGALMFTAMRKTRL